MRDAPLLPARFDWPSTIGNFLLNFGTLDYLILVFLKDNLEPSEFERFKERHFNDRVKRFAKYLSDTNYPKEQQEEFARLRGRLDPVRELRNHIAHGHMLARLDTETDTLVISVSLPKDLDLTYSPETRHVTFDELRASLTELMELIKVFDRLAGFKPGWRNFFAGGPALPASADEDAQNG